MKTQLVKLDYNLQCIVLSLCKQGQCIFWGEEKQECIAHLDLLLGVRGVRGVLGVATTSEDELDWRAVSSRSAASLTPASSYTPLVSMPPPSTAEWLSLVPVFTLS